MGKNLILIKKDGTEVLLQNRRTATQIKSGKQTWALNAEEKVNITVESTVPQSYDIGDSIVVFGRMYRMNRLPKVKRNGSHSFTYELEFEGVQYDLLRVMYDVTIDTTNNQLQDVQGDTLTGDLSRFMDVLIANANRVFPNKWAWVLHREEGFPTGIADKTLTFGESDNCLMVLQTLCNTENFSAEFEIVLENGVNTIHMRKRVGSVLSYTFKYGKGNGLYELNRDNVSSANIVTRLKVYGSTENITMKYRADRLCLPGKSKGQSYIEKADAVNRYGIFEGRKDFDVKPTFTGTVTGVIPDNVLSFIDNTFPFDINEKNESGETKYLIPGVEAKIHFITGNLAGYDFSVKSYDHEHHTFVMNKMTDERGDVFPSASSLAFQFKEGDKYKITDIAYSEDIEQEAEEELERQANEYYDQNCQPKVQYSLIVTKEWLKDTVDATDENISNVFAPGDYLHVVDNEIGVDKSVRIKSFIRNLLDYYDYSLTISDSVVTTTTTNYVLSELINTDKILVMNGLKDPTRARANWRSSRELLEMVFDPEGDYYTDKIKPNSIDTLALSVGAKSMQFGLANTVFEPNYNGNKNVLHWEGGALTHYTINADHAVTWNLADGEFVATNDEDAFYIYAKCQKSGDSGTIVLSISQHTVDSDPNYYYFWIGVLHSVDFETEKRNMSLNFGYTTINGRYITTGCIQSADGQTYFDLDAGEIGGNIKFRSTDGTLHDVSDLSNQGGANLYAGGDIKKTVASTDLIEFIFLGDLEGGKKYVASKQFQTIVAEDGSAIDGYDDTCIVVSTEQPCGDIHGWEAEYDWNEAFEVNGNGRKAYIGFGIKELVEDSRKNHVTYEYPTAITYTIKQIMLQEGKIPTGYVPYYPEGEDYSYIAEALEKDATASVTDVNGGLISTSLIKMRDPDSGEITAGLSGIKRDKVLWWGGGTYADAQAGNVNAVVYRDGTGKIGIFKIKNNEVEISLKDAANSSLGKIVLNLTDGIRLLDSSNVERVLVTSKSVSTYKPNDLITIDSKFDSEYVNQNASNQNAYGASRLAIATFNLQVGMYVTFKCDNLYAELGPIRYTVNGVTNYPEQGINGGARDAHIGLFVDNTSNMLVDFTKSVPRGSYVGDHKSINKTIYLSAGTHTVYGEAYYISRMSTDFTNGNKLYAYIQSKYVTISGVQQDTVNYKTVIGKDGMISVKSSKQYFMVKNDSDRQRIITRGLSTTKSTDGSGELYVTSDFTNKFKDMLEELIYLLGKARYEGDNAEFQASVKKKFTDLKDSLGVSDIIASS